MTDYDAAGVRAILDKMVRDLGNPRNGFGGQRPLADHLGVSQSFLSDVLNGKREPTGPILESLGLERIVTYRRHTPAGVKASEPRDLPMDAPCANCGSVWGDHTGTRCPTGNISHFAAGVQASDARPRYWCNKCGYLGPVQHRHQRPQGGECHYSAVPIDGVPPCDGKTK